MSSFKLAGFSSGMLSVGLSLFGGVFIIPLSLFHEDVDDVLVLFSMFLEGLNSEGKSNNNI